MSRNPANKNIPQAVLHHVGKNQLGVDAANVMPDADVRREGLRHIAKRAGAAVVATAVLAGITTEAVNAFDHSPVTQKFKQEQISPPTTTENLGQPVYRVSSEAPNK